MKIFNCQLRNGVIKKMSLKKIIRKKKQGNQVKIINVAKVVEK